MNVFLSALNDLEELVVFPSPFMKVDLLDQIQFKNQKLPLYGITIGDPAPEAPVLALIGGVHGLEVIGSKILISYLKSLLMDLTWDKDLQSFFSHFRLVAIPILNPGGVYQGTRSNPEGIDLMRNSPVIAKNPAFLIGGHRWTKHLPYYRGTEEQTMQPEAKALEKFIKKHCFPSRFSMVLDLHSGYGFRDRLWYPFARSNEKFPQIDLIHQIQQKMNLSIPHHIYLVEPQSLNYTTHGDLWDYLYDEHVKHQPSHIFIPWTLELGSWLWVRKNPIQLFHFKGHFNPFKGHRVKRILRRHIALFNFFIRLTKNYEVWK